MIRKGDSNTIYLQKNETSDKKLPEGENMQRARFGLTFHIFRGIWCIVCNTTLILQKPLFGKKPQKHFYPTNYLEQQLKNSNISRSEIPRLFFFKMYEYIRIITE